VRFRADLIYDEVQFVSRYEQANRAVTRENRNLESIRFLPTKVHGGLDYLVGLALILAPNIFQFAGVGAAAVLIPQVLGWRLASPQTDPRFGGKRITLKGRDK